jgi:hypothetical protein
MPIRRFLPPGSTFVPDDLTQMSSAFEKALLELRIEHREGEAASHVALRITTLAKRERDPAKLCEGAVEWCRRQPAPAA